MASLSEAIGVVGDTDFQNRVTMGAVYIALEVYGEDPETDFHDGRVRFGLALLQDPMQFGLRLAAVVAADVQIVDAEKVGNATDAAILGRIRAIWNAIAGCI